MTKTKPDPLIVPVGEPHLGTNFRVKLTTSCRDSDVIPKVADAGMMRSENGAQVQIMHNGLRVIQGGYHGDWMAEVIESLKGHHEPQEEVVFDAILKHVGPESTMIELGCFWSYYSLWFLKDFPLRRALGVEPDPKNIRIGLRNAELNKLPFEIRHGYIGPEPKQNTLFETESSGPLSVPALSPAGLVKEFSHDGVLDILHCDTQGAEVFTLTDCEELFRSQKIRFAVISTHAVQITGSALTHQVCLQMIKDYGGQVLIEHDVHESFSGDGLIAAYFGDEELDFSMVRMSRNRYSTSLFPNPIYQLEELLSSEADQNLVEDHDTQPVEMEMQSTEAPMEDIQSMTDKPLAKGHEKYHVDKSKLFSIPILGYVLHFVDAVFRLPRNDQRIKELRSAVDDLKSNTHSVVSASEPCDSRQTNKNFETEFTELMTARFADFKANSAPETVDIRALNQLSAGELNLKQYGLTLGRVFADKMAQVQCVEPEKVSLGWCASTQTDMESNWFAWWCQELNLAPIAHRKLWEYAWILQELHASSLLGTRARGVGFGCGEEPLPSYLAARGSDLLVTDLAPDRAESKAWREAGQHGASRDSMFDETLINRDVFDSRVSHRNVDMNDIPSDIRGYDFCWSVCAFEHLGSIEAGLKFVENSVDTLRPGGIALHTTEFNYMSDGETVEEGGTVLFRRTDFEELAERLIARGCKVKTINFDVGDKPIDRYIDIPPYHLHEAVRMPVFGSLQGVYPKQLRRAFDSPPSHLKLLVEQFPTTCFGIVVEAPE